LADCAAVAHLPLVASVSKLIYGQDVLAGLPLKDYLRAMNERASVRKVNTDRKANTELLMKLNASKK
jgi:glutathione S-transferase